MGTWQAVLIALAIWAVLSIPLGFLTARIIRKPEAGRELPDIQLKFIDSMIDEVLDSEEGASAWLDHKKMIIAKVFTDGEAWCDAQGNLVEKDDPAAVAHITFNVIRAAMMKFYTGGIANMSQEEEK